MCELSGAQPFYTKLMKMRALFIQLVCTLRARADSACHLTHQSVLGVVASYGSKDSKRTFEIENLSTEI